MKTNWQYCRPTADGKALEYAPVMFPPDPSEPAEATYNAHGWYCSEIEPPVLPEGKVVSSMRYEVRDNRVVAVYEYADQPPPVRIFSKLKLYVVLVQCGLWDALKSWLESQTFDGINAYTAFSLAQELTDAHPMFGRWYAAAKTALGVDDATAEAILAASEAEGAV